MADFRTMKKGGRYNWRGQPERLVYIGRSPDLGQSNWHQFEKVDEPGIVWCEVLDSDLHMIEETQPAAGVALPHGVELTDAGVPVRWNGEGRAVRAEVFAPPITCRGDPGECAHNGACMYACGVPADIQAPLTEEQIRSVVRAAGLMFTAPDVQVARAVERAHGIGVAAVDHQTHTQSSTDGEDA